ncbi:MAG TPA: DedA family protein [Candidatus Moranbacteria bacterium]|nr:DedA family protein [Candidatus Moranbacteria bacterium]
MVNSFDLTDPQLLNTIKSIGYPTMLILMIVEGPIATIIASFLSSFGFFNVLTVFILSVFGDITGDIILYFFGFWGGSKTLKKAEKILKIKPRIVTRLEKLFHRHGGKTIFAVKSTTGLCWITFIAAGTFKMSFKKFLQASFWGGIVWSSFLVFMGYFFGYAFLEINHYIKYAGILVIILAVVFYAALAFYKKRQSQKILSENKS